MRAAYTDSVLRPSEDDHDALGESAPHPHGHGHGHGGLWGFVAGIRGDSHDPADSIDDALTADARGIRALKIIPKLGPGGRNEPSTFGLHPGDSCNGHTGFFSGGE